LIRGTNRRVMMVVVAIACVLGVGFAHCTAIQESEDTGHELTSQEFLSLILSGQCPPGYRPTPAHLASWGFDAALRMLVTDRSFDLSAFEANFVLPELVVQVCRRQYQASLYYVRKAFIMRDIGVVPCQFDAFINDASTGHAYLEHTTGPRAVLLAEMALLFAKEPRFLSMASEFCRHIAADGDISWTAFRGISVCMVMSAIGSMLGDEAGAYMSNFSFPFLKIPTPTDITDWMTSRQLHAMYSALMASQGNLWNPVGPEVVHMAHWTPFDRWKRSMQYLLPHAKSLWPDYVDPLFCALVEQY